MKVREENQDDAVAIQQIVKAAFSQAEHSSGNESAIVDALRDAGMLTLSLVAEEHDRLVGHIAFSPVSVAGKDIAWLGLGPVSVRPDSQGQGTGSALIRDGLARIRANGVRGCVVLGSPDYYRRFGFEFDSNLFFEGVPPEYFMRLVFEGESPVGPVIYQPAFYAV